MSSNETCTSYVLPQFSKYFDLSKDVTIHFEIERFLRTNDQEDLPYSENSDSDSGAKKINEDD